MTDKTHQLIGLTAATGIFLAQHHDSPVTWSITGSIIIGSFFGSILPDIDQPTSSFWESVPLGGLVGRITSRALGGHRNLSHSILGVLLFTYLAFGLTRVLPPGWPIVPNILLESFIIGFIAHLLADSVTVRGIPIFWPFGNDMGFPPYPLEGIRIITGKWFEHLVVFPVVALYLIILVATHLSRFCPIAAGLCH